MRSFLKALGAVFVVLYPVVVYLGLSRFSARTLGLVLASLVLIGLPLRMRGEKREHLATLLRIPLSIVLVLLVGAFFNDRRFVLALPVVTNLLLLFHFATSLRTIPIAERFARMQDPALTDAQVAYCRAVTVTWCAFFTVNAAITILLALFAPLALWTIYTSVLAYVLVGLLATIEYVVRKYRFRKYGSNVADRVLVRIFPPLANDLAHGHKP